MQRSLLAAALTAALFVLSAAAAPDLSTAADENCRAKSAFQEDGRWTLNCGSSCSRGSCKHAAGRDVLGSFVGCRCNDQAFERCCQLVLDVGTDSLRAKGACESCGQTGECTMFGAGGEALVNCSEGGGGSH